MKHVRILCTAFLLTALVSVASASSDYTYVSRNWQNQASHMSASLTVRVPVVSYDAQGNPITTYQTKWIHANIRVPQDAQLRIGEVEYFRVSAYAGAGSNPSISVHVDPDLVYHSYRGDWSSTSSLGGHAYLNLYHNGRIKNVPPHSFDNVSVDFSDISAPFILEFDDFAYADNAEATTRYAFEIKRDVFLFPDKLIAKGEIIRPVEGKPTIIITDGCSYTADADEYFKKNKTYLINLKLKREGSQYYTDKWSDAGRFKFKWQKSGTIALERFAAETPRVKVRSAKFESLHQQ